MTALVLGRARTLDGPRDLAGGALLCWALLLAVALFRPALSPVFQWPLFFSLVGAAPGLVVEREVRGGWLAFASALVAVTLLAPVVFSVHVAAGAGTPALPAIFAVLSLGLLWPTALACPVALGRRTGGALLAAGVVMALAGRMASSGVSQPGVLTYAIDADAGAAFWLARGEHDENAFASREIPRIAPKMQVPRLVFSGELFQVASAPLEEWPAPTIGTSTAAEWRDGQPDSCCSCRRTRPIYAWRRSTTTCHRA